MTFSGVFFYFFTAQVENLVQFLFPFYLTFKRPAQLQ